MKTALTILLTILLLSCSHDYETGQPEPVYYQTPININDDFIGNYQNAKESVTVHENVVVIQIYGLYYEVFLNQVIQADKCYIIIILEDGTQIKLTHFTNQYDYVTLWINGEQKGVFYKVKQE
jgi:hypothetical protein